MSEGKKRVFRRFFYRGYEVEKLLDLQNEEFIALLHSRARRRFSRFGVKTKLVNKIKNAIKKSEPGKKPEIIKTHLRNMIIVPTMVGGLLGVYNGKGYILVEVKVTTTYIYVWWERKAKYIKRSLSGGLGFRS